MSGALSGQKNKSIKMISEVAMQGNVRPETMERITTKELAEAFIDEQVKELREQIGDKKVLPPQGRA